MLFIGILIGFVVARLVFEFTSFRPMWRLIRELEADNKKHCTLRQTQDLIEHANRLERMLQEATDALAKSSGRPVLTVVKESKFNAAEDTSKNK